MKGLLKYFLNIFGYKLIKTKFYNNLININSISHLDFHHLLRTIFIKDESICCFDIGANIGQTTKKIKAYYPNSTIFCFEPVNNTYNKLLENLDKYKNVNVYNCAMGASKGEIEIFHREHSEWNSLVRQLNENAKKSGAAAELIKVDTIDNFVEEKGIKKIDILKSDTEGFEMDVLEGAKKTLEKKLIKCIYIEVGFSKEDLQHTYWIEIIEALVKYEYSFSGLFEKCYSPDLRIHYANALFCSNEIVYHKSSLTA